MSNHTKIHPRRRHIHEPRHLGDRVSDAVCSGMGTWTFVIIQSVVLIIWMILNSVGWWLWKWDIYPFIAMNLLLSCQAAYASPLILMSQNRQTVRDRKRDDTEAFEVEKLFEAHELLLSINRQQLEILQLLKGQEPINALIGKLNQHEQWQNEMLTKVSAVLEKKPRARAVKQEVSE